MDRSFEDALIQFCRTYLINLGFTVTSPSYTSREDVEDGKRIAAWLGKDIEKLEISMRTLNCFRAEQLYTVGDVLSWNKANLMSIPNFGKKSWSELLDILDGLYLPLPGTVEKLGDGHYDFPIVKRGE